MGPGGRRRLDQRVLPGALKPRDSSAAAIAASALLDLGRAGVDAGRELRYAEGARAILTSLSSPVYLAQGTSNPAILLHGTSNRNRDRFDTGLIYGDYCYLESFLRLRWLPPATGAHTVAGTSASEGDAGSAVDADDATAWTASSDGAWLEVDLGEGRTVSKVTV
nr:hypothetical protein [Acidimicrobiia bacterium]